MIKLDTQEKLKSIYLRKLSVELIKRGITDKKIKSTMDEVETSLDEFISDREIDSTEELESNFGTVEQFCDNNILLYSGIAAFGQIIYSIFIIISLLIVPILSFSSLFFYPYNSIILGNKQILIGVTVASIGYGFLGTLFGLNVYTWLLYQHFKNRFSPYDIREKTKKILMYYFWLIFAFWSILFILPYTLYYDVIVEIWMEDWIFFIINNILRWITLGIFLLVIAILYTRKLKNQKKEKALLKTNDHLIDNTKAIFIFFILIGFILPNPGIGFLLLILGIEVLLFTRITGGIWIVGGLAILMHTIDIIQKISNQSFTYTGFYIIFGLKIRYEPIEVKSLLPLFMIPIIIIIIWNCICIFLIKKRRERFLPKFKIPKSKNALFSFFLLVLVMFSVLGSRPQYSIIPVKYTGPSSPIQQGEFIDLTWKYDIPAKGTIYLSIYTYIEWDNPYELENSTLEGNWIVEWDLTRSEIHTHEYKKFSGSFENQTSSSYVVKDWIISVTYIQIEAKDSGTLTTTISFNSSTFTRILPQFNVVWVSTIPQFPFWIEIMAVTVTFLSFFLTWEKKQGKNIPVITTKGEEENER